MFMRRREIGGSLPIAVDNRFAFCRPLELALLMFGLAVTVGVCWIIARRVQTILVLSAQTLAEL